MDLATCHGVITQVHWREGSRPPPFIFGAHDSDTCISCPARHKLWLKNAALSSAGDNAASLLRQTRTLALEDQSVPLKLPQANSSSSPSHLSIFWPHKAALWRQWCHLPTQWPHWPITQNIIFVPRESTWKSFLLRGEKTIGTDVLQGEAVSVAGIVHTGCGIVSGGEAGANIYHVAIVTIPGIGYSTVGAAGHIPAWECLSISARGADNWGMEWGGGEDCEERVTRVIVDFEVCGDRAILLTILKTLRFHPDSVRGGNKERHRPYSLHYLAIPTAAQRHMRRPSEMCSASQHYQRDKFMQHSAKSAIFEWFAKWNVSGTRLKAIIDPATWMPSPCQAVTVLHPLLPQKLSAGRLKYKSKACHYQSQQDA